MYDTMRRSTMLRKTQLIQSALEDRYDIDPIEYFEIPRLHHKVGKLVVAYANLTSKGFLNGDLPAVFGVTSQKLEDESPRAQERAQEVHVLAERLALTRGLMTPYGRASSEDFAASLLPESYRAKYIDQRLTHLDALRSEAETYPTEDLQASHRDLIIAELTNGISALTVQREELL